MTSERTSGQVPVTPASAASVATLVWRQQGRLRVTVIAKATFTLAHGLPMTPAPPEELCRAEVHHRNNPTQSVRLTSDLAPYLPRAEVILDGHACAPEGTQVPALTVRLSVFGERPLLDRTLYVYGDRKGGDPAPFDRMPLVYERTWGGAGSDDNPLGILGDARKAPNLIDSVDPQKVACFGPISRTWPSRRRLLRGADRKALDLPIAEIPDDLDFSYYNAAPPDQRVDQIRGDEWVYLEGMHPTQPKLQSRLPAAQAIARVYGLEGRDDGQPLALTLDTVRIEMDELRCSLTWRNNLEVPSEAALARLQIVAGVELPGQPIAWPPPPSVAPIAPVAPPPPESSARSIPATMPQAPTRIPLVARPPSKFEGTMASDVEEDQRAARSSALPFGPQSSPGGPGPASTSTPATARVPNRPPPLPPRIAVAPPSKFEGTMVAPEEAPRAAPSRPVVPFTPNVKPTLMSMPAVTQAPRPVVRELKFEGTMAVSPTEDQRIARAPATPFAGPRALDSFVPLPAPSRPEIPRSPSTPISAPISAPISTPISVSIPTQPTTAPTAPPRQPGTVISGVRFLAEGPLSFGFVRWELEPSRDCVTVFAKATCDLVSGGPAVPRGEAEPPSAEVEIEIEGRKSCVYPTDHALYKVRADVVLTGNACAPGGSATKMDVGLRVGEGAGGFDRTLTVFGDRRWEKGAVSQKPSAPAPFTRMPLAHTHAYGGPGFTANPVGAGYPDRARREPGRVPNLEEPGRALRNPKHPIAPACFAPIPLAWKRRWARLGREQPGWSRLGEELDWTLFQAAPRSQQLPFLRGDETFAITGMHPQHAVLEGALPGLRARGFAAWSGAPAGRFEEIPLRLDTVIFDVDALRLTLIWRAVVPVLDERSHGIDTIHLLTEDTKSEGISIEAARAKLLRR